jgi:hypothetical protein
MLIHSSPRLKLNRAGLGIEINRMLETPTTGRYVIDTLVHSFRSLYSTCREPRCHVLEHLSDLKRRGFICIVLGSRNPVFKSGCLFHLCIVPSDPKYRTPADFINRPFSKGHI